MLFHEHIPEAERYRISPEMLDFLRYGGGGLCGLETKGKDGGAFAWQKSGEQVYPQARFFHKGGWISSYGLDLACLDDRAKSGRAVILAASVSTGKEDTIRALCRGLLEWAKGQP